jgi:hypothetical protein
MRLITIPQSIHTLITGSKGRHDAIYPALLAIINNVSAYLENLNTLSCVKLLQMFASMSSPSFLLASETNHDLLASLLESINSIIEHKYRGPCPRPLFVPGGAEWLKQKTRGFSQKS